MTAHDHNKLLGMLLLGHGALLVVATIIVCFLMTTTIVGLLESNSAVAQMVSVPVILLLLAIVVAGIIWIILQFVGGWLLLKETSSAKTWATVACAMALILLPIGTIIGIYGIWFLSSQKRQNERRH